MSEVKVIDSGRVEVTVTSEPRVNVEVADQAGGVSPVYEETLAARDAAVAAKDDAAASATSATADADAAALSASSASTSASNADTSETNAATSATSAAGYRDKAQEWAENPEDAAVETGAYSALHHAAKASTSASNAASSASAASTSESNAAGSASAAADSASAAATSETNAGASETKAQNWAEQTVDTEVEPGAYSAKHHATKADDSASAAATSASNASTSESNAATSASNAATSETNAATSASSASDSAALAADYANADENVEVVPGEYSAKHWALQAQTETTGVMTYKGDWDASTNAFPAAVAPDDVGDTYLVATAGTVDGTSYSQGGQVVYNGGDPDLSSGWDYFEPGGASAGVTSVNSRTGDVVLAKTDVNLGNVDNTSDLDKPVSNDTQTALDGKAALSHTHAPSDLTQAAATDGQVMTWDGTGGQWEPADLPPDAVTSVNGETGAVSLGKADVGLGNVDNTADLDKPVSTAQQTALDGKANTSHSHAASDLQQSGATDGQVLAWSTTAGEWEPTDSGGSTDAVSETELQSGNYELTNELNFVAGDVCAYFGPDPTNSKRDFGFAFSTYLQIDAPDTANDASLVFTNAGAVKAEVGTISDDDLHFKTVSGAVGSETFTDRLVLKDSGFVDVFNSKLRLNDATGSPMAIVGNSDGSSAGAGLELSYEQANSQARISSIERGNSYRKLILESNTIDIYQGATTLDSTPIFELNDNGLKINGRIEGRLNINAQTASYTLALTDAGQYVRVTVSSANNVTVPAESSVNFPIGTQITIRQAGAGQTTIVEGTGVTVTTPETLKLRGQHSTATLVKVGSDLWDLMGDLEAAA